MPLQTTAILCVVRVIHLFRFYSDLKRRFHVRGKIKRDALVLDVCAASLFRRNQFSLNELAHKRLPSAKHHRAHLCTPTTTTTKHTTALFSNTPTTRTLKTHSSEYPFLLPHLGSPSIYSIYIYLDVLSLLFFVPCLEHLSAAPHSPPPGYGSQSMQSIFKRSLFDARGRFAGFVWHAPLVQQHLSNAVRYTLVSGEGELLYIYIYTLCVCVELVNSSWLNRRSCRHDNVYLNFAILFYLKVIFFFTNNINSSVYLY